MRWLRIWSQLASIASTYSHSGSKSNGISVRTPTSYSRNRQEWTLAEMHLRPAAFDARLKSLHLGCISAAVRLHLGCISALSASMPSMKYVIIAHTGTVPHGPTTGYLSTAAAVKRRRPQARRALPENCGT